MFDVHSTTAPAYCVEVDGASFRFAAANDAALRSTGLVQHFYHGLTPADCFPPAVAATIETRYRACRDTGLAYAYQSEISTLEGTRRWTTTLVPVSERGTVTAIIGFLTDVVEAKAHLTVAEDKTAQAIGAIDGGFWVYDLTSRRFETSRCLSELLAGPGRDTLDLATYAGYIHAEDINTADLLSPGDRSSVDFRVTAHDGRTLWLQSNQRTVRDADGAPLRVVGLVLDVTARKSAMQALETEALTDSLTGLMNRRGFERSAARLWRERDRTEDGPCVTLVDIDGFKSVNDRNGHLVGDELLRQVARRLTRAVRRGDVLSRFGGDEFAVVSTDKASAGALEERIRLLFAKPFQLGERAIFVGASVGSSPRRKTDRGIEQVLGRADAALYIDKASRSALRA